MALPRPCGSLALDALPCVRIRDRSRDDNGAAVMRPTKSLRPTSAQRMAVTPGPTRDESLTASQHHRVEQCVRHAGSQRSRVEALFGWRQWPCSSDGLMRLLRG